MQSDSLDVKPKGTCVYNFEVMGAHNYYVSADGIRGPPVLVHNKCADDAVEALGKHGDEIAERSTNASQRVLYHYTTHEGMSGILDSNKLLPSLKKLNPKDVRYGNGQYLTDIIPGTMTQGQLSRALVGVPWSKKFTNYVKIDVTSLDLIKGRNGVFVVPNEKALDLVGRILGSGSL